MITTTTDITVRYVETDKMGIVHHSVYAVWFEAARTEFIKFLGISYSECEKRGVMLPLVSLECKYIKPAYYEDEISIEAFIDKMTPVRLTISYRVLNKKSSELLATGTTNHVWTNDEMRPVNLKKYNHEIYEIMSSGQ